jgi:hypothetical protein
VPATTDRATHTTQQRQQRTDDDEHDTERPDDGDFRQKSDNQEYNSQNYHDRPLSFPRGTHGVLEQGHIQERDRRNLAARAEIMSLPAWDHLAVRSRGARVGAVVFAALLCAVGCSSSHPHAPTGPGPTSSANGDSSSTTTTAATVAAPVPIVSIPPATAHRAARPSTSASRAGGVSAGSGAGATIAGCPLFPADDAWRQNISAAALDPHSAAWVASIGASVDLHPDFGSNPSYGIPYVVVPKSQAKVPITFTAYGDQSDPGPYPVPLNAPVEAGGDAHVLVASANCNLYELYDAKRTSTGWSADAGAVFNLNSDKLRPNGWTSADAAGLPILPGLVRRDEVLAGQIDHALRFTISTSQSGYIHPATHDAGSTTDPNVPPMGARFRLKASFSLSGYHGAALVILQALKTYGMFVADNGSNWYLSGATDPSWNDDDLDQLKSVPGSAFEAVYTGPVLH